MKKKVNVGKGLFLLAVFCIMFLGSCMKPEAASRMKKLKVGRTYTTRLTGNEKHKVKFTYTKRIDFDAGVLNLYVDGKLVKRIRRYAFTWEVNLCRVSPKRTLLYLRDCSSNDYNEYMKLLEYKDGRFIELGDLVGLTRNESYEQTDKLLSGLSLIHISLNRKSASLYRKEKLRLEVRSTSKSVPVWKSSKKSVAVVDSNGTVTAVKNGTAIITVTVDGVKKSCEVTVKKPTVQFEEKEVTLSVGEKRTVHVKVSSGNKPAFSSSNSCVAEVDKNGRITAKDAGKAYIYASEDGVKSRVRVVVK